jgi:hypothetical protein
LPSCSDILLPRKIIFIDLKIVFATVLIRPIIYAGRNDCVGYVIIIDTAHVIQQSPMKLHYP